jgi:hypothetical protein
MIWLSGSRLECQARLSEGDGQFAHWRQTRAHPSERMPSALWEHAVALAAVLPPARVAKQLRLRLADLKKQMVARHAAPPAGPPLAVGFVEVPPIPVRPPAPATIQLELSRADGTRLCLHAPAATLPLEAMVRAFVEGH